MWWKQIRDKLTSVGADDSTNLRNQLLIQAHESFCWRNPCGLESSRTVPLKAIAQPGTNNAKARGLNIVIESITVVDNEGSSWDRDFKNDHSPRSGHRTKKGTTQRRKTITEEKTLGGKSTKGGSLFPLLILC